MRLYAGVAMAFPFAVAATGTETDVGISSNSTELMCLAAVSAPTAASAVVSRTRRHFAAPGSLMAKAVALRAAESLSLKGTPARVKGTPR